MKNQINQHIKNLSYHEYANPIKFDNNYIDLRNNNSQYEYQYSQDKDLIQLIAKKEGIPPKNILLTAGADNALHHIAETFLEKNKKVLIPIPSFPRYEFHAKIMGVKPVFVNIYKKTELEKLNLIKSEISKKNIKLLFLASPNNPTGESFSYKNISNFLLEIKKTVVVIDQALSGYFDDSLPSLALKFPNVIVVKSFSKLYNLPGLRIGYIITSDQFAKFIKKTISPYELSSPSITITKTYLKNLSETNQTKNVISKSFNYVKNNLKLNFSATKNSYLLIDGGIKIPELYKRLTENRTLTIDGKNFRGLEKENTIRIILTDFKAIKRLVKIINFLLN